jgi:hypothetical protein
MLDKALGAHNAQIVRKGESSQSLPSGTVAIFGTPTRAWSRKSWDDAMSVSALTLP